ncbi:hypothetical protein U879_21165 [Defluviimonas sp. 20V17]|uniref:Cytochrome c-type biogenesis protein n=1 Tax=Allgaiera indica TaxID=765699 RepID=A0AAN4UTH1_9RHOB|nr:cytochrome c biogenesis protein CcdA [Allgaiera indica]KDB01674.1 hypothetical protein U879_21165 [Defluviimonas sp. 20V17]GHE03968.1 hypothetical protein GCM10008024_29280 [Allgaiera indica]SDX34875.1 cytochrome c-type biogenesis protein [Allgaiera indica]
MILSGATGLLLIPAGLGLFGFVEPCSIGTSLIFLKYLEGKSPAAKFSETLLFGLTRAILIGLLGAIAAYAGSTFLGFQRGAWLVLGLLYICLGVLIFTRRVGALMVALGPGPGWLAGRRGALGLGLLFGLNIPACAAPLLLALLAGAAGGALSPLAGFVALAVFGFFLSAPLIVLVLIPAAQRRLDRLAALSGRFVRLAGLVLIGLGAWSVWFGLFVDIAANTAR